MKGTGNYRKFEELSIKYHITTPKIGHTLDIVHKGDTSEANTWASNLKGRIIFLWDQPPDIGVFWQISYTYIAKQ